MKVDYFGGCPTCGRNDGYLDADRIHVAYCEQHRVAWIFGANVFGSWRHQTEAERIEKYKLIEGFELVEPLLPEDAHVVLSPPITDDDPPRTVKQMADVLKDIAEEVALAAEQHDHSALPRCAVNLRRIADRLIRGMEDAGLGPDDAIPF